jgi:polyisoprenoid-binding protein YceI
MSNHQPVTFLPRERRGATEELPMKSMSSAVMSLAVLTLPALAGATPWDYDTAHSRVGFSVRHMMVSNVKGQFKTVSAKIELDAKAPEKSSAQIEIDVASIDTGVGDRDNHLRSPEFFDVAKFPKIVFKSKKVGKLGGGKYNLVGDLTIRGVTKEVTLVVEGIESAFKNPFTGKEARGATVTGSISRKDFGLTWNKVLEAGGVMVGDEVLLQIELELTAK